MPPKVARRPAANAKVAVRRPRRLARPAAAPEGAGAEKPGREVPAGEWLEKELVEFEGLYWDETVRFAGRVEALQKREENHTLW